MKYLLSLTTSAIALASSASGAFFADQVVSYSLTGQPLSPSAGAAALGAPSPLTGVADGYPMVYSAFNPHYEPSEITEIKTGGHLTLRLSHFVMVDRTPGVLEIGVWENAFLEDITAWPNQQGVTAAQAASFGQDSAVVSVSEDGQTWYSLNGGSPILFTLPGNYFTSGGPYDAAPPAGGTMADFGKPFTGNLASFNGKTYQQTLAVLDGSAGGTWLNLDSVPASVEKIAYVRFDGIAVGQSLEITAVAINNYLDGGAVPEPGAALLSVLGAAFLGTTRRRS